MTVETLLVFNPHHQEGRAVSGLRGHRALRWDRPVRAVPHADAVDLIRLGGCHECIAPAAVGERFNLSEQEVIRLAEDRAIAIAEHEPADGEAETVVVLDPRTAATLVTATRQASKGRS